MAALTNSRIIRIAMFLLAALNCASSTGAQDFRTYVGGGFSISPWSPHTVNGGSPSLTFVNTSADTTAMGIVAEAGGFITPRLAAGVEIGLPFRCELTREYGYFEPSITRSRYRDLTLFGIVRAQTPAQGRARVALVGGGGLVQGSSLQRVAQGHFGSNVFGPFGDEEEVTHWTVGATFGGDLILEATRHVAVVPQFRVLVIRRGSVVDRGDFFADLGFNSVVYRAGVGLRAAF